MSDRVTSPAAAGHGGHRALTGRDGIRTVAAVPDDLRALGWDATLDEAWSALARRPAWAPARVRRIDRGWSSLLSAPGPRDERPAPLRVRNIGADVAVGDWVVVSDDGERVDQLLPRRSAFVRRASFEGAHAEAQPLAANIDVVFLVHALSSPPNDRRLERELVLAYDSGATPVIVLTKADLIDDVDAAARGDRARRPDRSRPHGQRPDRGRPRRARLVDGRLPHHRPPRRQRRGQVDARQRPRRDGTSRTPAPCARVTTAAVTRPSRPS